MGACVSIRKRHEGKPSRKSKKKVAHHSTTTTTTNNNNNRKRRRAMKKRVSSCFCDRSKSGAFPDRSFSTPTFQGISFLSPNEQVCQFVSLCSAILLHLWLQSASGLFISLFPPGGGGVTWWWDRSYHGESCGPFLFLMIFRENVHWICWTLGIPVNLWFNLLRITSLPPLSFCGVGGGVDEHGYNLLHGCLIELFKY